MKTKIPNEILKKAFELMCKAKCMTELYEANKEITSKYVHATSRGHEAIQIALGIQLLPQDYLSAYYRDDSILLSIGLEPFELMLQLLAKRNDPFSAGRTYYSHPSLKRDDMPKIPHQSSATGMQAIPTTGIALGLQYLEKNGMNMDYKGLNPIAICSLGDASCTEGEVSEAFQMAVLKQLPILFLVQDNEWDISAKAKEFRSQDITEFSKGFKGLETKTIDGTDFILSYNIVKECINTIRTERRPMLIHAKVPLLNHHTSGVRKEWYRDDLAESEKRDPLPRLRNQLIVSGIDSDELKLIELNSKIIVENDYQKAILEEDPLPEDLFLHEFAPTQITEEKGERSPIGKQATVMVDSALFAIRELMTKHPECLLYGQDVGARLGGVFREAATLGEQFGENRVFNTPIQEAFIVGSTVGMSAVGLKPIVEVQFADYIYPGFNQLVTEISKSSYLSCGKFPVQTLIRVPIGAYGGGGPYHSGSIETTLLSIKGIKVVYPSNPVDAKGLLMASIADPNPVLFFEHKALYRSISADVPDEYYQIPMGKAKLVNEGEDACIITYGMGVIWAQQYQQNHPEVAISILDLRSLAPLDNEAIREVVKATGKVCILHEDNLTGGIGGEISAWISEHCFAYLDAPIMRCASLDTPIPFNLALEKQYLANSRLEATMQKLLNY